ncbi:MAG TPA: hypothetical protein VGI63_05965, partial [Verrucomicrobiae bacterium]
ESVPCSAEMVTVEIIGEPHSQLDPEMLRHAAASVFHYFKVELERESVTVGEFSRALEKVLSHLGYTIHGGGPPGEINDTDLLRLVHEAGDSRELFFFPRLRDELRVQLRQSPRVVRFRGLRGCVKQLTGVRRWSPRCEHLQDQIVEFLRSCLTAETEQNKCALVVE